MTGAHVALYMEQGIAILQLGEKYEDRTCQMKMGNRTTADKTRIKDLKMP